MLYNLELSIETNKVQINNLISNIDLNNSELESMSGNIEILKNNTSSPDNKLTDLEKILNENLKVQNIKDTELKKIRSDITDLSDKISLLENFIGYYRTIFLKK